MVLLVDPVIGTSETHFHFDRNMDGCMTAKEHDCTEDKDFETMKKEKMLIHQNSITLNSKHQQKLFIKRLKVSLAIVKYRMRRAKSIRQRKRVRKFSLSSRLSGALLGGARESNDIFELRSEFQFEFTIILPHTIPTTPLLCTTGKDTVTHPSLTVIITKTLIKLVYDGLAKKQKYPSIQKNTGSFLSTLPKLKKTVRQ